MILECLTGGTPKLCKKESPHSHHPRDGVDPVIMGSPRWCVHHMTGCCFSLTACCLGGRHIVICPENWGVKKCACPERWCLVLQGQERPCNLLRIWVTVHQLSPVHIWSPVSDSTIVKMNIHFAITFTVVWHVTICAKILQATRKSISIHISKDLGDKIFFVTYACQIVEDALLPWFFHGMMLLLKSKLRRTMYHM